MHHNYSLYHTITSVVDNADIPGKMGFQESDVLNPGTELQTLTLVTANMNSIVYFNACVFVFI